MEVAVSRWKQDLLLWFQLRKRIVAMAAAELIAGSSGGTLCQSCLQCFCGAAALATPLRSKLRMTAWPTRRRIGVEQEGWLRSDGLVLRFELDQASGWREDDARLPLQQGPPGGLQLAAAADLPLLGTGPGRVVPTLTLTALQTGEGLRQLTVMVVARCGVRLQSFALLRHPISQGQWRTLVKGAPEAMPNSVNSSPVSFEPKGSGNGTVGQKQRVE